MVMLDQEVMIAMPSLHLLDDVHWRQPRLSVNWYPCLKSLIKPQSILDWHLSWCSIVTINIAVDSWSGVNKSLQTCHWVSVNRLPIKCQSRLWSSVSCLNQDINFHISISIETCIEHQMRVSIGTQLCKSSTLTLSEKNGSCHQLVYLIGLHAVQFGNNWMKKNLRTAKIGRGHRLSEEFFESNYFQIGQACSPLTY